MVLEQQRLVGKIGSTYRLNFPEEASRTTEIVTMRKVITKELE